MIIDAANQYFLDEEMAAGSTGAIGAHNSAALDHGVMGGAGLGEGEAPKLRIIVQEDFVGVGGTVAFKLQHSDDGSAWEDTGLNIPAVAVAELVSGFEKAQGVPEDTKRHTRVVYTIATTAMSAGKFSAFLQES